MRVPPRAHRWLVAGVLSASLAVAADVRADSTWRIALHEGEREGLIAAPERLELGPEAEPSTLYHFAREGRFRSVETPLDEPPAQLKLQMRAETPPGTAVLVQVRTRVDGRWQPWEQVDPTGRLLFERPAQSLQMRVVLLSMDLRSPTVASLEAQLIGGVFPKLRPMSAPTYRVYATREGLVGHRTANGHRIGRRDRFVALPSWKVLNDRGEKDYQVRISYRERSVVVPVWDVGPWNTRDNYWSAQREMWRDLPRGLPQAQAAHQQGYNGGRDQFGRRPNLPNGIDIADGTFWEDLGLKDHAWVEVTFLWLGDEAAVVKQPVKPRQPAPAKESAVPGGDTTPPVAGIATAGELHPGQYFLRWSGKDEGSGVASFDVQVRHGAHGAWQDWLRQEQATEGLYKRRSQAGTVVFRVRARDRAGNLGDYSTPAEAKRANQP